MKIGIELGSIVPGKCGGIVPLLQGVLGHLFAGDLEEEVVLFCTPGNAELFPPPPGRGQRVLLDAERFYPLLDRHVAWHRLNVLFRSYPVDIPLGVPMPRQVVLVPDLQHEFFPRFFTPKDLGERSAAFAMLRRAGSIATLSEHARQTLRAYFGRSGPDIFLMSPALCAGRPVSAADLTESERDRLPCGNFLYPSNLWPHKNHRKLLQAFDRFLQQTAARFELVLTGDPAGWTPLAAAFPHLPVRHLGYVRREFLQVLFQRARALLFFSLYEGFGMPLLEAFQAGIPVACSNTTSLPEVAGDAALTCDPNDALAMSEAMARVGLDDDVRRRLIVRGPERLAQYNWHQSANLLEACRRVAGPLPALTSTGRSSRAALRRIGFPLLCCRQRTVDWLQRLMLSRLGVMNQYAPRPLVTPFRYAAATPPDPAPAVSVVTPTYNQAAFLKRTMDSVLNQNYPRLEYIVQDGGSTDGTVKLLEQYSKRLACWRSAADRGQAHALNLGFRHATGDILAYLNSDDLLLPGALAYVAGYFARHPEVDVVYGHRVVIDSADRETGRWLLPPHDDAILSWVDYVPQETLFWRRRIWERVGARFDETFQFAMDWDLILRFRDAGARFVRLPRFLGAFRTHARQKTIAHLDELHDPEVRRLRLRCHGRDVSARDIARAEAPYLRRHSLYQRLYDWGVLRLTGT